MTTSEDICGVCKKTHPWPDGTMPKHPHTPAGGSTSWLGGRDRRSGLQPSQRGAEVPETTAVAAPWPFDPVLRQALVDKGILTVEDLRAAEAKIRDMSAIFNMGGNNAEQASGKSLGSGG